MLAFSRRLLLFSSLLALAMAAWIITVERMRGMDAGPGTDLGSLGWYLGVWVTMMAGMMLPSVAPVALLFARVTAERARRKQSFVPVWVFVVGYLVVWTALGLVAYGLYRAVAASAGDLLAWDRGGPYVAGGAVAVAGLYELTPLKQACLRHCRTPLHFLLHGWRRGWAGAVRMGAEHGAFCMGCCWALMLALFALGLMSLFWMAALAGVIFLEKIAPGGERLTKVVAIAFVALGIWVAAAPDTVPGLTEPQGASMGMVGR